MSYLGRGDRLLGVGVGVGADEPPFSLFLGGVSWRGGVLGVPVVFACFQRVGFYLGQLAYLLGKLFGPGLRLVKQGNIDSAITSLHSNTRNTTQDTQDYVGAS